VRASFSGLAASGICFDSAQFFMALLTHSRTFTRHAHPTTNKRRTRWRKKEKAFAYRWTGKNPYLSWFWKKV